MRRTLFALGVFLSAMTMNAQTAPQLRADNIDAVLHAMTLQEKVRILVGTGMPGVAVGMPVVGSTRTFVPGAAGLRIDSVRKGSSRTFYCTHFPIGTSLSSSWNVPLVENVGKAIGNEVLEYGADVLLAPANNIQRNPLCGRNFEYYSEDPVLSGNIAAAYIRGVQSNGVGTSLKHFCFNNQETKRMGNDARVGSRAAHEIYLKAFEIAVKKGQPWTVMSSYNKVNGTFTSESPLLLTKILRNDWGFKGLVMTDWFGGKDRSANINAGNDLIQPGLPFDPDSIMAGVKDGRIKPETLDRSVRRVLQLVVRSPRFKGYQYSNNPDLKAHALVTRNSAVEGMVLLKNNGVLPLKKDIRNIAVYGATSYRIISGGTGSGDVNSAYTVSLIEGLRNNGYQVDNDILKMYEDSLNTFQRIHASEKIGWWEGKPRMEDFVPATDSLKAQAQRTDVAVITLGRVSGEGVDRPSSDFYLTEGEKQLISNVTHAFHQAGKKVVVLLNIGGVIETASWKAIPDAILLPWQCGQEGGNSMADVLSGARYPSGKLPMTFPVDLMDVPSSKNMPLEGKQVAMSVGKKDESQNRKNIDYTNYDEGIWIGYRYFDTFQKNVSYPFGYGLGYTTFSYSGLKVVNKGSHWDVSVTITNNGTRPGKEVAEVYVTLPGSKPLNDNGDLKDKQNADPLHELKAFAKTRELNPGEHQTLTMTINRNDLASFREQPHAWVVAKGHYRISIGASVTDIREHADISIR